MLPEGAILAVLAPAKPALAQQHLRPLRSFQTDSDFLTAIARVVLATSPT